MKKLSGPLARRYGTALFDSLHGLFSNQKDAFETASKNVMDLANSLNKQTRHILKNQTLDFALKQKCIHEILMFTLKNAPEKLYKILFEFLSLVIKNGRIDFIQQIFAFYFQLSDKYLGIVRANIISANTLTPESSQIIESVISNTVDKKIVFSNYVDESLQAGFLVKIGSVDIDTSLKSFLSKLQESVR